MKKSRYKPTGRPTGRPNRKYEAGLKFGRLTLVEVVSKNKYNHPIWKCLCDCGNYTNVYPGNLSRTDGKATQSCGCFHKEKIASKQVWEVEFNKFNKDRNRRNGVERKQCTLLFDEWKEIVQQNCTYCGAPPSIKTHVGKEFKNTVDRVDSSKPYSIGNAVACCHMCNTIKRDFALNVFIVQIIKIIKHLGFKVLKT